MAYQEQTFDIPSLAGISPKQLEIHLKLYAGYVKFTNHLADVKADLMKDSEKNAYALGEVNRRLGFEYDGMKMHEFYFSQWEKGANPLDAAGNLGTALSQQFGDIAKWEAQFKAVGMTRGIGWTILYFDPKTSTFHNAWVGDHELGQLVNTPVVLAMDMWEHAYMVDYTPAEKKDYIEAFFKNLNWELVEQRFTAA